MSKAFERLKKHLIGITDAVNSFDSEEVQLNVITRVIDDFSKLNHSELDDTATNTYDSSMVTDDPGT